MLYLLFASLPTAVVAAVASQVAVALGVAALIACDLAGVHPACAMKIALLENADRDPRT